LSLLNMRTLSLVFVTGPLAALLGLQLAVYASSRVNDPRSAQQVGAIMIAVPIAALQIAQFVGGIVLTAPMIGAVAAALGIANAVLLRVGIAVFDRESILTRWR
jgi:ABC-2 type transport system permease protein